ncbi:MAG TPA: dihydrofolate reductase family protein [Candidatus Yaniella excrementigallinarum]|nr:dihydrofolate reductase family protein [Candidatus Yaniella excrementigallinarum]
MATITAFQNVTLDGVMQAPGRPDEDTRQRFVHGGWSMGYQDEVSMAFAQESMSAPGALLLGWRTYEDLMGFWTGTAESNPFTEVLVNSPKYVVCSSQRELQWPNSTLLIGKPAEQIDLVRKETDLGITLMGSCALFRALHSAALIDDYVLQIHPITLGSGRKLFGHGERKNLELVRSVPTGTGVIIAHYRLSR